MRGLTWKTRRLEKRIIQVTSDYIFLVITSHRKEFMRLLEFKMWAKELPLASVSSSLPVELYLFPRAYPESEEMSWLIFIFEYYGNVSWCFCVCVSPSLSLSLSLSHSPSLPPGSIQSSWLPTLVFPPSFLSSLSILSDFRNSFHKAPQLGNTTQSSISIPPAKSSLCQPFGSGLSHRLLPRASHPGGICADIKEGPWQFSRGSQQAPHTCCGLCRLSSRPFCSLSGMRVHISQLPPASWSALECMGQRGAMVHEAKKKSAPLPILHFSLCSAQQTKVQVRVREMAFTFETQRSWETISEPLFKGILLTAPVTTCWVPATCQALSQGSGDTRMGPTKPRARGQTYPRWQNC